MSGCQRVRVSGLGCVLDGCDHLLGGHAEVFGDFELVGCEGGDVVGVGQVPGFTGLAGGDDDGGELEEGFEGGGVLAFAPAVDEGLGELALGDAFGDDGGAIGGGTVGLEGGDALGDGVVLACLGKDAGEGALDGGRIGVGIQGKGIADGGEAGGGCLEDGEPASKGVDGGGEAVGGVPSSARAMASGSPRRAWSLSRRVFMFLALPLGWGWEGCGRSERRRMSRVI